ncbi:MAG TPA: uracil-DNA glycosylase [Rhodobacterales bacterium]|nr:uracil-DNA glycosylase [Rhodobacterales bacterium]
MDSALDWHGAKALLEWYVELGASDAVGEGAVNRYDLPEAAPKLAAAPAPGPENPDASPSQNAPVPHSPVEAAANHAAEARRLAQTAPDLAALAEALRDFDGLELKKGARNFVFADGNPAARVMIVGEAPGADEDRIGRPFVGRAGQLLDRMFAAIGLSRDAPAANDAFYITNVLPWRPPANRTPSPQEAGLMLPFLERHIALVNPQVLVLMGNTPCGALLGRTGILRMRGNWKEALGKPALPMTHPAYLLRSPAAKREAWADLLSIQAKLRETP